MSNFRKQTKPRKSLAIFVIGALCVISGFPRPAAAQQSSTTSTANATATLPSLVRFGGKATDANGKPLTGLVGITFALYEQETGGPALWLETQSVQLDSSGRYTVLLGTTKPDGLPASVFASGQARWVGAQTSGQSEQPRVMLSAVPYAMKAGDAATIGGLPPSAFMLASPAGSGVPIAAGSTGDVSNGADDTATPPPASSNVTTTGGTASAIPMFTSATNIQNSILTQAAGTLNVSGKLNLPTTGAATATAGKSSRPEDFVASSFNSTSTVAVPQTFQLQAEPAANNTAAPSGTLNFLYGSGTTAPKETGFRIGSNGLLSFAPGQTFPGTGTITGVTTATGSGLTGGGTTGTLSLGLLKTCATNQTLQWNGSSWICATLGGTITGVTAGTDLTGGGTSGSITLNVDTTKVPQLLSNNRYTGTQKFTGNAGIGANPSSTGYTPLTLGGATNFGTWFAIANTSTGGHTWNIISAGSGNAEGAGNIGITDLTGKSTIWLEGNTNTANLTATGTVGAAALVVTSTAGAAIIDADGFGQNAGAVTPGLRFGGGASGEGIASNRVGGINAFGLQLFTEFLPRLSILQDGRTGIGATHPTAQLEVDSPSNGYASIFTQGGAAPGGSGQNGSDGIDAYGNSGDGAGEGGAGGVFSGGGAGSSGLTGEGIVAFGGSDICLPTCLPLTYAADFQGSVFVTGGVWVPNSAMYIDDPVDPANKYLTHSSVESSDMKNIYDGNVTTDASGQAVVELPEWFESLNRDFRYQLTTIGQPAQAWIASKIANHAFTIKTDKPNVEISWQVTGIRQDAWANAHRIPVETPKSAREAGHYLHPELFGAPEESSITWARHPEMMKKMKRKTAQLSASSTH